MVQSKLFYVHPLRLLYSTVVLAQTKGKGFFFASEFARDTCLKFRILRHLKHFVNNFL